MCGLFHCVHYGCGVFDGRAGIPAIDQHKSAFFAAKGCYCIPDMTIHIRRCAEHRYVLAVNVEFNTGLSREALRNEADAVDKVLEIINFAVYAQGITVGRGGRLRAAGLYFSRTALMSHSISASELQLWAPKASPLGPSRLVRAGA